MTEQEREGGPAIIIALLLAIVLLFIAAIWAVVWLVKTVDEQERECIQRNGENYCKTVAP